MSDALYPFLNRPRRGYVFVVTYGRSGSTLAQNYLNSFDAVVLRGENANLLYHLARAADNAAREQMIVSRREQKSWPRDARSNYLKPLLGEVFDPWHGAENIDPEAFARGLFDGFVRDILQPPHMVDYLGFKEVRWTQDAAFFPIFLDLIARHFPNSHFLFQTRNWEDVSRSNWWQTWPKEKVRGLIERADACFADYAATHDNCLTIQYEAFLTGLQPFRDIAAFLDLPYDEATARKIAGTRLMHGK